MIRKNGVSLEKNFMGMGGVETRARVMDTDLSYEAKQLLVYEFLDLVLISFSRFLVL